jgi:hypothetical protein
LFPFDTRAKPVRPVRRAPFGGRYQHNYYIYILHCGTFTTSAMIALAKDEALMLENALAKV